MPPSTMGKSHLDLREVRILTGRAPPFSALSRRTPQNHLTTAIVRTKRAALQASDGKVVKSPLMRSPTPSSGRPHPMQTA